MSVFLFDVSVVVPVYNMEKYLHRCVDSLLKQTLKKIEIILVDDGSKDSSPALCDKLASANPGRVVVLHKPNGGLTSAWKAGSKMARGRYIGYVDSDDFVLPDMYERMYTRAMEEDADIACVGLHHIYENGDHDEWDDQMVFPKDVFSPEDLKNDVFPVLINDGSFMGRHLHPNRVTKLVKNTLVQKNLELCDDAVSIGEDFQFSLCMFMDASKVVIIKDYFPYYYCMNDASMTMKYDANYMDKIKILKSNLTRISSMKEQYDFDTQIINDFLCLTVLHLKGSIFKRKTLSYKELKKDMKDICTDPDVIHALKSYCMPQLTAAEKLFIFFMKHHCYFLIYLAIKIYFN